MKVHLHVEQFDGNPHPWCGRGKHAVTSNVFEATDPKLRCQLCESEWFPQGQPDWHRECAREEYNREMTPEVTLGADGSCNGCARRDPAFVTIRTRHVLTRLCRRCSKLILQGLAKQLK